MADEKKKSIPEREEEILKFWNENKIFEKSLAKNRKGKTFVFYEGPPTANGLPGIHHVEARAFKDIIPRYKTMRGFHVPRKAGWDTHGLPVEIQVEKELGLKSKQDIERYGIGAFNQKAKESVWRYKEQWEKLTKRMGFWVDLTDPYITYETSYIESLWWIIKEFWKKGLLEKDFKILPWCVRCQTGLSSHEVGQGYKKTTDTAVYVKFKLKPNQKIGNFTTDHNTYILAWTTTPWTLPGNVGLAVGESIEYRIVQRKNDNTNAVEFFIVAVMAEGRMDWDSFVDFVAPVIQSQNLVGLEYEPLFNVSELKLETAYRIYPANFVSADDGTGVVHTAVMYGEDDYNLGNREDVQLPKFHTVDETGHFIKSLGEGLGGLPIVSGQEKNKETEEKIIQILKEKKALFADPQPYEHDYPFCWRCSTPLLYYARQGWWVRTTKVKKQLIANNETINWVPDHLKRGRFGEFLKDVRDWAFSRERYWGTPLPIWSCQKCAAIEVVGSQEELQKRSGKLPRDEHNEINLHRPYVDMVTFACKKSKCGGVMARVPEVADVWFDSGAMPFAQSHYPFDKKKKLLFPADYISEAVDQTRGWFYTLLAVATLLGKKAPYKNVISLGHVLDKNGQKMSKSKGNIVDPSEMIGKYGVDALRWYFYTINAPGEPKKFDERDLGNKYRGFIMTLWNSFVLFDTYVKTIKISAAADNEAIDEWIIVQIELLTALVTKALEAYDITSAGRMIEEFVISDFSQWYLQCSRRRLQKPESKQEFNAAAQTTAYVLLRLALLCAPFAPFLAEAIYRELKKKCGLKEQSVHLCEWPKPEKIRSVVRVGMGAVRKIVALALQQRADVGIKVRQPLGLLEISREYVREMQGRFYADYEKLIKDRINIKQVKPAFIVDVKLHMEITLALREEGMVRELVRNIQEMRRDIGLAPKDVIRCQISGDAAIESAVSRLQKQLQKDVNAKSIVIGHAYRQAGGKSASGRIKAEREIEMDGKKIRIRITRL